MKKLSIFAVALTMLAMVACKGKKEKTDDDMMEDSMTTQVMPNASDDMNNMNRMQATQDSIMREEELENEVFGGGK